MTIQEWINTEKVISPELADFLTKISPYLQPTGFNANEFERKVGIGIRKAETDVEESLNTSSDAYD